MTRTDKLKARIEELEVDLRYRDDQIKELREERNRAIDLADEMREYVEDSVAAIESWAEVFEIERDDNGKWVFRPNKVRDAYTALREKHNALRERHIKLVRDFNWLVGKYNRVVAPRSLGRPLLASEAQIKKVRKLRKATASLRTIAEQTGLGLQTVRTIIGKDAGTDRTGKRTKLLRKREIDRLRAADYRVQKRAREQFPKQIIETRKRGEALVKAAKGLGG